MTERIVIYVHGMGGSADEAEHFVPLFPECDVVGFDYRASTPWDAKDEFGAYFAGLKEEYKSVTLIANSIGAYFSVVSGIDRYLNRAYFISPVADMERLILDMLESAGATEQELEEKGVIQTGFGEDLSWKYLSYVREHQAVWKVPTDILYGSRDVLIRRESVDEFVRRSGARLTVFEGGEHWFHTAEQMRFLDEWIKRGEEEE